MIAPLDSLKAAVLAAFPALATPRLVFSRVFRNMSGRLSLQNVNDGDAAPDMRPVEIWPGVPGVTSDPTPGEVVIVVLVGEDQMPAVIGRAAEGQPGHVPLVVRLDAKEEIRVLGKLASAAAVMRVGSTSPAPLAHAAPVQSLVTALKGLGTTLSASPDPSVQAVGGAITSALSSITITETTKLEAQ